MIWKYFLYHSIVTSNLIIIMSYHIMHKIAEDSDIFRKNIVNKLKTFLPVELLSDEKSAINLEKGIYNYAVNEAKSKKILRIWSKEEFVMLYIDRLRTVYMNINRPEIQEQLKNGEITPQSVAFMTHQEMHPEHWRPLIEQKMKRDENKYNVNIEASTDIFTCKKCKSKRCTYYELQTRSADEPATIFVSCLDCGKHWKN